MRYFVLGKLEEVREKLLKDLKHDTGANKSEADYDNGIILRKINDIDMVLLPLDSLTEYYYLDPSDDEFLDTCSKIKMATGVFPVIELDEKN